jgi:hypothetical protein
MITYIYDKYKLYTRKGNEHMFEEVQALLGALEKTQDIVDEDIRKPLMQDLSTLARFAKRRHQKNEYDDRARQLIGAMVPKETAVKIRTAAEATNRSTYRFVRDALATEYTKWIVENTTPIGKHEKK